MTADRRIAPWKILLLVCGAQFMVILDVSVVNVALPSIRADLGFSATGLQWVVNGYTLTFAGLLLLGGRAGDLLGRRRMFVIGITLFSVSSLLGGLAQSEGTLIAARALQGIGGAIVAPSSLAILMTSFEEGPQRTRAFGLWGTVIGLGGAAGTLLGGLITETLSWRWILFINVPIGALLVVRALRDLDVAPPSERATLRSFDLAGALSATLGLTALVWAIVRTETVGWGSPQTVGVLALGLTLLAAFAFVEARVAVAPMLPLRILGSRQLVAANLAGMLQGASMFAMWFLVSLYVQGVLGFTALQAGLGFLPLSIIIAVCSSQSSKVVARLGVQRTLLLGFALSTTGLALLSGISADGSYLADVLGPAIVLSTGVGLCIVPITMAAMADVQRQDSGIASGLTNVTRMVGGSLGLAILATIAGSRTASLLDAVPGAASAQAVRAALADGYGRAFLVAAGFALLGGLATALLVRDPAPAPAPAEITEVPGDAVAVAPE